MILRRDAMFRRWLVLTAAILVAIAVVASSAAAAVPKQLLIAPTNPYWTLLSAQSTKAVPFGGTVGTCKFVPSASCPGAQLINQNLSGAFVPFGDFTGVDFSGSKLSGAELGHTNFASADLAR